MPIFIDDDAGNTVNGSAGDDEIYGNGGDDVLNGLAGDDLLVGGPGNDTLVGGSGNDTASYASASAGVTVYLFGGLQDTLGAGIDSFSGIENLIGSAFDDDLRAGGNGRLDGGEGNDTLRNGNGSTVRMDGGPGNDRLIGGGSDIVIYDSAPAGVTVDLRITGPQDTGAAGIDTITGMRGIVGSAFDDVLIARNTTAQMEGGAGNDTLYGPTTQSDIFGGGGDDVIVLALTGSGVRDGGEGFDVIRFENLNQSVAVRMDISGPFNGSMWPAYISIEMMVGTAHPDIFVGNGENNIFEGGQGDDSIDGGGGADTAVFSGVRADYVITQVGGAFLVSGPNGEDSLTNVEFARFADQTVALVSTSVNTIIDTDEGNFINGSAEDDVLVGNGGDDVLNGLAGDDLLDGGTGDDTLDGGSGSDTVSYASAQSQVAVRLDTTNPQAVWAGGGLDTLVSIENLIGSPFPDTFIGNGSDNVINGGPGNDTVSYENAGTGVRVDLRLSTQQDTLGGGLDTLISIENVTGSPYNDTLMGATGPNYLRGGSGDDVLFAGGDEDTLMGGDGFDTVSYANAGAGVVVLFSSSLHAFVGDGYDRFDSIEYLIGSNFDDWLQGTANDDRISGGPGDDILIGGAGNDVLEGDSGFDLASYASAPSGVAVDLFFTTPQNTRSAGIDTLVGIEDLEGSAFGDLLLGNSSDNRLMGGDGNDYLLGDTGDDVVMGGNGFDFASYELSSVGVNVSLQSTAPQVTGDGVDTLISIEGLVGSVHADSLSGNDAINVIYGHLGDDVIDGGANIDTALFFGDRAEYTITTNGFTATVVGPDGTDTLTGVEFFEFNDMLFHWRPGTGASVNFSADPDSFMGAIRDFDGNNLGGANSWDFVGSADLQGDGDLEYLFFNAEIGRWASVGPAEDGLVYFSDHGWAGDTRVVGIYIDPLVESGHVVQGSDHDSQRRFQNDLFIGNIDGILGAGDYDDDGLQEVYFSLTDGTAYLHAYMHADGNIRYANYQSEAQVIDFLTSNGYTAETWDGWFS